MTVRRRRYAGKAGVVTVEPLLGHPLAEGRLPARPRLVQSGRWAPGSAFLPNATEAVWELAEHRYLYIEELPERAGRPRCTWCSSITSMSGSKASAPEESTPASQETYGDGVRKVIYRDLDGNEVSFGGAPLE